MIFGRCVAVVERNAKFENGLPGVFLRYCSELGMFFAVCFGQHKSNLAGRFSRNLVGV